MSTKVNFIILIVLLLNIAAQSQVNLYIQGTLVNNESFSTLDDSFNYLINNNLLQNDNITISLQSSSEPYNLSSIFSLSGQQSTLSITGQNLTAPEDPSDCEYFPILNVSGFGLNLDSFDTIIFSNLNIVSQSFLTWNILNSNNANFTNICFTGLDTSIGNVVTNLSFFDVEDINSLTMDTIILNNNSTETAYQLGEGYMICNNINNLMINNLIVMNVNNSEINFIQLNSSETNIQISNLEIISNNIILNIISFIGGIETLVLENFIIENNIFQSFFMIFDFLNDDKDLASVTTVTYFNFTNVIFSNNNCTTFTFLEFVYNNESSQNNYVHAIEPYSMTFNNFTITQNNIQINASAPYGFNPPFIASTGVSLNFTSINISNNVFNSINIVRLPLMLNSIYFRDSWITNNNFQNTDIFCTLFDMVTFVYVDITLYNSISSSIMPLYKFMLFYNNSIENNIFNSSDIIAMSSPYLFMFNNNFTNLTFIQSSIADTGYFVPIPYSNAFQCYERNYTYEYLIMQNDTTLYTIFNSTADIIIPGYDTVYFYRFSANNFTNISDLCLSNSGNALLITDYGFNQSIILIDTNYANNMYLEGIASQFISVSDGQNIIIANNTIYDMDGLGNFFRGSMQSIKTLILSNNNLQSWKAVSFIRVDLGQPYSISIINNIINNCIPSLGFIYLKIFNSTGSLAMNSNNFTNNFVTLLYSNYQILNFIHFEYISVSGNSSNVTMYSNNFCNNSMFKNISFSRSVYDNSFIYLAIPNIPLFIVNSTFFNSTIKYDSNFMLVSCENIFIQNSTFSNITTYDYGVAIYAFTYNMTVINSTFANNSGLNNNLGTTGGAIGLDFDLNYNGIVTLTIIDCIFEYNGAGQGGSIFSQQNNLNLTIINSSFINNLGYLTSDITLIDANESSIFIQNINVVYNSTIDDQPICFIQLQNYSGISELSNISFLINSSLAVTTFELELSPNATLNINDIIIDLEFPESEDFQETSFVLLQSDGGTISINNLSLTNLSNSQVSLIQLSVDNSLNLTLQNFSCNSSTFGNSEYQNVSLILITDGSNSPTSSCNYTLIDSNFSGLNFSGGGSVIEDQSITNGTINVESCLFENMSSLSGTAITTTATINNNQSKFINISNSNFFYNTAEIGGSIYNVNSEISISNSNFSENSANFTGGAILNSYIGAFNSPNTVFQNNSISIIDKPNDVSSFPSDLNLTMIDNVSGNITTINGGKNNSSLIFNNVSNDFLINTSFYINMVDSDGNQVYDVYNSTSYINFYIDQISSTIPILTVKNCTIFNCSIPPQPALTLSNEYQLTLKIEFYNSKYEVYSQINNAYINFTLNECVSGQYNDPTLGVCVTCLAGQYSFDPTVPCEKCMAYANCLGGDELIVIPGFWRPNTTTSKIYQCPNKYLCINNSQCLTGYTQNLCLACDVNNDYSRVSSGECAKCGESWISWIYLATIFIVTLVYQMWYIEVSFLANAAYSNKDKANSKVQFIGLIARNVYVKLLTNYAQFISIILTFHIDFFQAFGYASFIGSPTTTLFSSFECAVQGSLVTPEQAFYLKALLIASSPIIYFGIILLIYLFAWRFKLWEARLMKISVAALCVMLVQLPGLYRELSAYLSCTNYPYEPSNSYVESDPTFQCYTSSYNTCLITFIIPGVLTWGFIIPLTIFIILYKNRTKLFQNNLRIDMQLGSIYKEYRQEKYYWGILVIIIKLLLLTLGNFLSSDLKTKGMLALFIIAFYLFLFLRNLPYEYDYLNKAETTINISYVITLFFMIYYLYSSSGFKKFSVIVIVIVNIIALYKIFRPLLILNLPDLLTLLAKISHMLKFNATWIGKLLDGAENSKIKLLMYQFDGGYKDENVKIL